MKCEICHAEMKRYATLGHNPDNPAFYGEQCARGHFNIEVQFYVVWVHVMGIWITRDDPIVGVLLFLRRTIWMAECSYRHKRLKQ